MRPMQRNHKNTITGNHKINKQMKANNKPWTPTETIIKELLKIVIENIEIDENQLIDKIKKSYKTENEKTIPKARHRMKKLMTSIIEEINKEI